MGYTGKWQGDEAVKNFDLLFTLRVSLFRDEAAIMIRAYDGKHTGRYGHSRVEIEVRQAGKVIFPRGSLYVGIPFHASIDGLSAKEAVMACVAMKPGDTDAEYFADYSPAQLEWAKKHGESLDCERMFRYCDKDGNPKGKDNAKPGRYGE